MEASMMDDAAFDSPRGLDSPSVHSAGEAIQAAKKNHHSKAAAKSGVNCEDLVIASCTVNRWLA